MHDKDSVVKPCWPWTGIEAECEIAFFYQLLSNTDGSLL
jgi:hypothetical protein